MPRRWPADEQLLIALASGDESALQGIWDRHAARVARVIRAQLGADPVVDDLLQEVFLALWHSVQHGTHISSLEAYLVGISVRRTAGEIRRRKRKSWFLLWPTDAPPDILVESGDPPTVDALRRILLVLTERQYQVFWLRYVEEYELTEIAALLGLSESTVKREIKRARERIVKLARMEPDLRSLLDQLENQS